MAATSSLFEMMSDFYLVDGWREAYLETKEYILVQKSIRSKSHIDKIYTTQDIIDNAAE